MTFQPKQESNKISRSKIDISLQLFIHEQLSDNTYFL